MPVQTLPRSAEAYTREQRAEIAAAIRAVKRQWRGMGDDFESSYAAIAPSLLAITDTAQLRVATGAVEYVPAVLEETNQTRYLNNRAGDVRPAAFMGMDGSGRPVDGLLYGGVVHARSAVAEGRTTAQALAGAGAWLSTAVGTLLSDTGRAAEVVGMANHRVGGYVRMLVPPSCSRCAILAGKWFAENQGFKRHPGCDCRHIPSSEGVGSDMTVDTRAYFDSLSAAEQDRIFTQAGAEAIREGADINQVVNARRGMTTAQSGRIARDKAGLYTTRESRTRRGMYGSTNTVGRARLMPESIREIAKDRDDYVRLLRTYGYIL